MATATKKLVELVGGPMDGNIYGVLSSAINVYIPAPSRPKPTWLPSGGEIIWPEEYKHLVYCWRGQMTSDGLRQRFEYSGAE